MNYLLVKPEELDGQGYDYRYAERIPDGRVILPPSALRVLSNFTPEILDDKLKALIKEQKESGLYNPPEDGLADGTQGEEPGTGRSGNNGDSPGEDIATEEPASTESPVMEEGGEP